MKIFERFKGPGARAGERTLGSARNDPIFSRHAVSASGLGVHQIQPLLNPSRWAACVRHAPGHATCSLRWFVRAPPKTCCAEHRRPSRRSHLSKRTRAQQPTVSRTPLTRAHPSLLARWVEVNHPALVDVTLLLAATPATRRGVPWLVRSFGGRRLRLLRHWQIWRQFACST